MADINSLQLEDNELVIDPTADPDARTVPPEGKHVVKLSVDETGEWFTVGKTKRGQSFVMVKLTGSIVADGEPWNNSRIFDSRSTVVFDSNATCGLMAIPIALKAGVPQPITKTGLATYVRDLLQGGRLIGVQIQWQSRYQDANGAWKTFKKGMRTYPERTDKDGNPTVQFAPEVEGPDGQIYPARAVVIKYMPVEEVR